MPNWCCNTLRVWGGEKDLAEFAAMATEGNQIFSFGKFFPKVEGTTDWYAKNMGDFGCKWDIAGAEMWKEKNKLIYQFDSAWSPPELGIFKISKMYPKLSFRITWNEPSELNKGWSTYRNGYHNGTLGNKRRRK